LPTDGVETVARLDLDDAAQLVHYHEHLRTLGLATEEGEYQLLLKMWNFLKDQVSNAEAAGKTIGIFHYSTHEKTWWRTLALEV